MVKKECKKDLTPSALLEMDGSPVNQDLGHCFRVADDSGLAQIKGTGERVQLEQPKMVGILGLQ